MLKKRISFVTALVMMITLLFGQVQFVSAQTPFVAAGYEIVDSAYDAQNGVYVLMAKNYADSLHKTVLYTSADGKNWVQSFATSNGKNYHNTYSGQNITYWDTENIFVAAIGGSVYTSADGLSWTVNEALDPGSNLVVESGNGLIAVAGGMYAVVASSLENISDKIKVLEKEDQYLDTIAIDSSSKVYISSGNWIRAQIDYSEIDGWMCSGLAMGEGFNFKASDYKFINEDKGWITEEADDRTTLSIFERNGVYSPKNFTPLTVDGMNTKAITAIGSDSQSIFFGTSDGSIYFIGADANLVAGDLPADTWSAAVSDSFTLPITEEVTDINCIGEGKLLVTTLKSVYVMEKTADGYVYSDPTNRKELHDPVAVGELPFEEGVKLLGGTYSPELNRYAVYGNDADGKGHIYYSDDGINWNTTGTGTSILTSGMPTERQNAAVWWPAQQAFVISNATQSLNGAIWYSKDGISWVYNDKLGFGNNGDLAVVGDYLYSASYSSQRVILRYSDLENAATKIFHSKNNIQYNLNVIALSDDATPYVFLADPWGMNYVAKTGLSEDEVTNAIKISNGQKMLSAHYNDILDKFVSISSNTQQIYITDKVTAESFGITPDSDSKTLAAIKTNGSTYLVADAEGTLYFASTANLGTDTVFNKVNFRGTTPNTLPVTNIITGADGKYLVTVSDGTTSDILIVDADGLVYRKASEYTSLKSISAGMTFTVTAEYENFINYSDEVTLIAAIYSNDGTQLQQVEAQDIYVEENAAKILTMEVTANENIAPDSKLKLFIWDSLNGMVPLCNSKMSF